MCGDINIEGILNSDSNVPNSVFCSIPRVFHLIQAKKGEYGKFNDQKIQKWVSFH